MTYQIKKNKKKKKNIRQSYPSVICVERPKHGIFSRDYNLDVYNILKSTVEMITTVEIKIIW